MFHLSVYFVGRWILLVNQLYWTYNFIGQFCWSISFISWSMFWSVNCIVRSTVLVSQSYWSSNLISQIFSMVKQFYWSIIIVSPYRSISFTVKIDRKFPRHSSGINWLGSLMIFKMFKNKNIMLTLIPSQFWPLSSDPFPNLAMTPNCWNML